MKDQRSISLLANGAPNSERNSLVSGDVRSCLTETAGIFLALIAFDIAFLGAGSLNAFTPHPFWIPVILIAAQHATAGGLFSAIIAISLSFAYELPVQAPQEDYYTYLARVWAQPALWLSAAVIIGEIRMRHLFEHNSLFEQMHEYKTQRQSVSDYCTTLETRIDKLEHKIATTENQSMDHLLSALDDLSNLTPSSFKQELPPIMHAVFGQVSFSLFEFANSSPQLILRHAPNENNRPDTNLASISLSLRLHHTIATEKRLISVLNPLDADLLGNDSLFAIPVFTDSNRNVAGVLKIHALDPSMVKPSTQQLLKMVSTELGDLLGDINQARDPNTDTPQVA